VIIQLGTQGSDRLVEILKHPVADMQALAALELSTDALKAQPKAHRARSQAMQHARGTGLQLALAIALGAQDDFEALRRIAVPFLTNHEDLSYRINTSKQANPSVDVRQIEKAILSQLVGQLAIEYPLATAAPEAASRRRRSAFTTASALAIPDKGRWVFVPAVDGLLEPLDDFLGIFGMLTGKCSSDNDTLDGLSHIQPLSHQ